METNLKDNIYITGFDRNDALDNKNQMFSLFHNLLDKDIIYIGLTKDITEDIAKECVIKYNMDRHDGDSIEYENYQNKIDTTLTAKESILSACKDKYCIIFRK